MVSLQGFGDWLKGGLTLPWGEGAKQAITATKKILRCSKHGTQMGWLIAPVDKAVHIYRPQQEIEILDEPDGMLPMPNFMAELTVTTAEPFALLLL